MYFSLQNLAFLAQRISQAVASGITYTFPTGNMLLWVDANSGASLNVAGNSSQHFLDMATGIADASGITNNNYVLLNGAYFDSGNSPKFMVVDGVNDYAGWDIFDQYVTDRPVIIDLSSPFTISTWTYYPASLSSSSSFYIFGQGDISAGNGGFGVGIMPLDTYNRALQIFGPSGAWSKSDIVCPSGTWLHITVTRNSDNLVTGYVNRTGVVWGAGVTSPYNQRSPVGKAAFFEIGRITSGSATYAGASGRYSAVYCYSGALTSGQNAGIFETTKALYGY